MEHEQDQHDDNRPPAPPEPSPRPFAAPTSPTWGTAAAPPVPDQAQGGPGTGGAGTPGGGGSAPAHPADQRGALPPSSHRPSPARVPVWLWPVVCLLALVLGLVGGIAGSAAFRAVDQVGPGLVSDGLDGVDTVSEAPLEVENGSVAAVARALLPSTVQVVAELDGEADGASGSGFLLDRQGHVVTNNHVVEGAADGGTIRVVAQDGRSHPAEVVGRSAVYDLAVLRVREPRGIVPAALGSASALHVGETVVAIGSPLGLSSTVTAGIVSAKDRPVTTGGADETSYINAVQTDAAINPGNSGGPLVNLRGEVVGVNSAIATTGGGLGGEGGNIGVGFAIPIEQVKVTTGQILRTGEARYPVIGAQVRTGGQVDGRGALIDEVMDDTPAERAGLQKGDRVVEVGGQPVNDGIALIVAIRTHQPGETVPFVVLREGREVTVEVELGGEVG